MGTQDENQEGRALVKGRRLLQGGLQGGMNTEHKSGEIQMMLWAQVPGPVSYHPPIYPAYFVLATSWSPLRVQLHAHLLPPHSRTSAK